MSWGATVVSWSTWKVRELKESGSRLEEKIVNSLIAIKMVPFFFFLLVRIPKSWSTTSLNWSSFIVVKRDFFFKSNNNNYYIKMHQAVCVCVSIRTYIVNVRKEILCILIEQRSDNRLVDQRERIFRSKRPLGVTVWCALYEHRICLCLFFPLSPH